MIRIIFSLFTILFCSTLLGQTNDTWYAFWNKDSTLFGYKDKNGTVKIEPKFTNFCYASKFDDIIAVSEEINGDWINYHITKAGRIVGRDSFYTFDNMCDCESEGFIRFRDTVGDCVGLFDRKGNIRIPATYNALSSVRNGFVVGLKGAVKTYWDKDKHSGCNHFTWTGGEEVLLDTLNQLLVENFSIKNELNFFSFQKTKTPTNDTTRVFFLGKDSSYYSFLDSEKEFKQWLFKDLLSDLNFEKLLRASYDSITVESGNKYTILAKDKAMSKYYSELKKNLLVLLDTKCKYFIMSSGFMDPFMDEQYKPEKYYNNCGEYQEWQYPVMDIVISHGNKKHEKQNHYVFLRTDSGYQLISMTIR